MRMTCVVVLWSGVSLYAGVLRVSREWSRVPVSLCIRRDMRHRPCATSVHERPYRVRMSTKPVGQLLECECVGSDDSQSSGGKMQKASSKSTSKAIH